MASALHVTDRTASAGAAPPQAGTVRAFCGEDAPAVATLCQRVFLRSNAAAPPGLAAYFAEALLRHPWFDPATASLVHVAPDGAIRGFIGCMPLRMSFQGRPIRAAVASSMMVEDAAADPLAGARLLRRFFQGPQELSIGENATAVTHRMWIAAGARTVPLNGLAWMRILRPAGFAAHLAARRVPLLRLLHAPGAVLDAAFARLFPAAPGPATARGEDVAPEELAGAVCAAVEGFALRPDFDARTLRWLLSHAACKRHHGEPVARIVTLRGGGLAGGYLAHLRRRGAMRVVQAFAQRAHAGAVVDDMFAAAARLGATAVTGRNQPEFTEALQLRGCYFRHGGFTLVHSRKPELLDAVARGDAFLNGLAGEAWARLSGDTFD